MHLFALFAIFLIGISLLNMPGSSQGNILPSWNDAGYRGTGNLPSSTDITTNANCIITPSELASTYGVNPNDGVDDSLGLQNAIDTVRANCAGNYNNLSLIELPAGTINTSTEIHIDASFLIIRGQGSQGSGRTAIIFEPGSDTVYDGISDFDLGDMTAAGSANGGWIWPGRGAFRVQTRAVDSDYLSDYNSAPANRKDFFEGSVNFHWKGGIVVTQNAAMGDTSLVVDTTTGIAVGRPLWVGAPNTEKMYQQQGVDSSDWRWFEYMRQQIFTVTAINGNTVTLDKPLEFDVPRDSTADGSSAIDGRVRDAKVIPLDVVEGVGLEGFYLTQVVPGHTPAEATYNYNNVDHTRAMHGIVFRWVDNAFVNDVHTYMTGSHAIVTEMARHIQIQNTYLDGSWNKGKGGNGYFRLSKAWNSLVQNNTLRNLRHLAVQWSASNNIIQNNDITADLNLHGGWERYNLFQNNIVRVPYEHRDCNPNCSPGAETWYPIWWAAGQHAGGWSGASGPQNVFYNNTLGKQLTSGGNYTTYTLYGMPGTVYMLGWDRDIAGGSYWVHLSENGTKISTWTGRETTDFSTNPNTGVNDQCASSASSLVGASLTCNGQVQPTNTPVPPTTTPIATSISSSPTPTQVVGNGACTVTASYGSQWNSGYNADVFITNNGSATISGWTLTFEFSHGETITDFWRVYSWSQSGAQASATVNSGGTRGDIAPGDTVDIKYQVDHNGTYDLPVNYILNGFACNGTGTNDPTATDLPTSTPMLPTETPLPTNTTVSPTNTPVPPTATDLPTSTPVLPTATPLPTNTTVSPTSTSVPPTATDLPTSTLAPPTATSPPANAACTVTFAYDSEWGDGYTAEVFITNNGTTAINGWTLTFTFNHEEVLDNFWRVQNAGQVGAVVTAFAGSGHYNGTINAGQTTDVKYQVSHNGTYSFPTGVTLNGQSCN